MCNQPHRSCSINLQAQQQQAASDIYIYISFSREVNDVGLCTDGMEYLRTIRLRDEILALSVFGVTAMAAGTMVRGTMASVQWDFLFRGILNGEGLRKEK